MAFNFSLGLTGVLWSSLTFKILVSIVSFYFILLLFYRVHGPYKFLEFLNYFISILF